MVWKPGAHALFAVVMSTCMFFGGTGGSRAALQTPAADPVLIAAGDVAKCGSDGAAATSALVGGMDGTVALLGDGVYSRGTSREYARCYAAHPTSCTLAYWHHPRFSSGSEHGDDEDVAAFWEVLYTAGADVVLAGHEHNYERFFPQNPAGDADPERGIRAFVVGTGGRSHYGFDDPAPTSELRDSDTFGVLALTLHPDGYDWAFSPIAGESFHDEGSGACHA